MRDTVTDLALKGMPTVKACQLVGYPRASYYRHCAEPAAAVAPVPQSERHQPAALSDTEKAAALEALNRDEYVDLSISQVFHRVWDEGNYICSRSSWYRIARDHGQVGDRRRQATCSPKKIPELTATAPNQVWSWDITKLKGPDRGQYFHLYVITDIYSRYVTGWRLEAYEDGALAGQMIDDAIADNERAPAYLHSDNGAAMISKPVSVLLEKLKVGKSFSRPHTSNDNPYSEALFKTCKYDLQFPGTFDSFDEAMVYCRWFFHEYNHHHRHSGIGWHTPSNVHHGRTSEVSATRRQAIDKAWRANPQRFSRRPKPPTLPDRACINDPRKKNTTNLSQTG